jgi:hypothetical protein
VSVHDCFSSFEHEKDVAIAMIYETCLRNALMNMHFAIWWRSHNIVVLVRPHMLCFGFRLMQ